MKLLKLILLGAVATACGAQTTSSVSDVQADDLWAGLTTYTFSRYVTDHCQDGRTLDTNPANHTDWVRQRAGYRRVCFQVWKPGVTDVENANYWRELDVQVHFKTKNGWQKDYVNMADRQGNNLRYSWEIPMSNDPFYPSPTPGMLRLQWGDMVDEDAAGRLTVNVPFYFTVNGKELKASNGEPFKIRYDGYVREFRFETAAGPLVLYPNLTCDGLVIGTGAGYHAIDISDAQIAAKLKTDIAAGERFGARMHLHDSDQGELMTFTFNSRNNAGQNVYQFTTGYMIRSLLTVTLEGDQAKLVASIQYDGQEIVESQAEFSNCSVN